MEYYMDIDTGGTFTDGFVRGNGRTELIKVDTTPHDFTICFMECIEEAANRFGLESVTDLLSGMRTLRLSTTIGTNTLIQGNGPKLGLLVTSGPGDNAYAKTGDTNPAVDFLIQKEMIIGIDEETDGDGNVICEPASEQVLSSVKDLLERGARRIVISLARSPLNPANEQKCRELILEDYPAHYLGSVPLLLSSEISSEVNDMYRTNAALIDAYIHREMEHYLYKADDDVRNRRYRWPLLIVHATGGVARVAKTKAIDTCDSGPSAGLFGAAFLARLYGIENVVTVDVGGTSTDIGLIARGNLSYTSERKMYGIPVRERVIETISIGGGGSSIAWVDGKTGKLRVGPESAGAIPGPACYSLGGNKSTVADAWVILGYIDPDYFLGGRRKLDTEQARKVIQEQIAGPLGISVEDSARAIIEEMHSQSAKSVREFIESKGLEPVEVSMFAFGGAGGLVCTGIAENTGIPRVYLFPFGAQFCAFGSSCTDVLHSYSRIINLELTSDEGSDAVSELNSTVKEMTSDAYFDMKGEGFDEDDVVINLELVTSNGEVLDWEKTTVDTGEDMTALIDKYHSQCESGPGADTLPVKEIRLKASAHLPDPEFTVHPETGENTDKALKGKRTIYWKGESQDAGVYELDKLGYGNTIKGPALIESPSTTVLVPPGSSYTVDEYLHGILKEN
jgi:N-methylhydantoinase A